MASVSTTIRQLIERSGGLPAPHAHKISVPPDPSLGDLSSNIALIGAKQLHRQPLELAKQIAKLLKQDPKIAKAQVAPPGFINITLSDSALADELAQALQGGFGTNQSAKGKRARVEFVSANPTGPLHIGNARGGPLGDTIANVLAANGYNVLREYINNDRGNQVRELGESIIGQGTQYQGDYVKELKHTIGEVSDPEEAGRKAVEFIFKEITTDCGAMGISFDYVVHESQLQQKASEVLQELNSKGLLKEKEGALWFIPGGGDELEAVVRKSDGSYLYFTADVVYHREKFLSGYDLVVDVFGSNTFGHVPKLKALAKVYGFDLKNFKVVLYQFVRVKRGAEVVAMSKRAGSFVTAAEVLDEVGKDAFRFFMLLHDPKTHMDFDLELAKKQSRDNPVYYVQYAVARIHSIFAKVKGQMLNVKVSELELDNPKIRQLTLQLVRYPNLVAEIGETLEVHRLTHYALETAGFFHEFYESLPVLKAAKEQREGRLALARATLNVLEHCLKLMGVSAPEKM